MLCIAALLCSCSKKNKNTLDEGVSTTKNVLLKLNGQYVILLEDNRMQYCTGAKLFRGGSDDMSSYFELNFDKYPSVEGETVGADLSWKESGGTQSRTGLELSVAKIEDEVIWLSGDSGKINAVIRKN